MRKIHDGSTNSVEKKLLLLRKRAEADEKLTLHYHSLVKRYQKLILKKYLLQHMPTIPAFQKID